MRYKFEQIATIRYGKNQKKVVSESGNVPIYGTGGLMGYATEALYDKPSVLIGRKGTIDKVRYVTHPFWTVDTLFYTVIDESIIRPHFFYYLMTQVDLLQLNEGTTIPSLRTETLNRLEFEVPSLERQDGVLSVLEPIEEKIKLNTKINDNLLQQAQAIYREMFVDATNDQRRTCRAEEYFDIAIGKTPPRKEYQWFTTGPSDVTWVSISDMGNCGTYISKSSEQLTQEAIDKFNIKIVPNNTVLLSFKLTVGRIAITCGEMATNEAIAHFKTDKPYINEYLYCYLRDFNYQTMGSTSSIAIAVNSKIIKAMPFVIPTDEEISRFHSIAGPMFEQILNNQLENGSLAEMRDALLPRLMSGELDVSALNL